MEDKHKREENDLSLARGHTQKNHHSRESPPSPTQWHSRLTLTHLTHLKDEGQLTEMRRRGTRTRHAHTPLSLFLLSVPLVVVAHYPSYTYTTVFHGNAHLPSALSELPCLIDRVVSSEHW